MSADLSGLSPSLLWKYFDEIRKIPRCSKHEEKIGDYIISVAQKTGHEAKRDEAGNIVVEVPGTKGHEKAKTVVLQGHMDMVCEKNSDVKHDFTKDPIDVEISGDWVTAKGTTLGADNGIGVAAALAFLEDRDSVHGPLELLFTVDEETGLNGAVYLKPDFIKGRVLLNLDSEEEGTITIGCAGGGDSEITMPVVRKDSSKGSRYRIMLSGLRGGHSGIDIHKGRGNAIQLLARLLYKFDVDFDLIDFKGGSKHNAIPREAFATVFVKDEDVQRLKDRLDFRLKEIEFEYKAVEEAIKLKIEPDDKTGGQPLDKDSRDRLLALLYGLPHGVVAMSQEIEGLVETSNNVAIVECKDDHARVYTSTRSSIQSALEAVRIKIEAVATLAGAEIKHLEGYPSWTPNLDSDLLKVVKETHKKIFSKEPKIEAIHAGLECGIIGEKYPGMEMVSIGPELQNPHSPDERVNIGSVERFWEFLTGILKELS